MKKYKTAGQRLRALFAAAALAVPGVATAQDATPLAVPVAITAPLDLSKHVDVAKRDALSNCADGTQSCWSEEEQQAGRIREMQMVLMTAQISCASPKGYADLYNAKALSDHYATIVTLHKPVIQEAYDAIKKPYDRQAGSERGGMLALDQRDTALANSYGAAIGWAKAELCPGLLETAQQVAQANGKDEIAVIANRIVPPQAVRPPSP